MIPLATTAPTFKPTDRIQLAQGVIATITRIDHKGWWIKIGKRAVCYTSCHTFKLIPPGMDEREFMNRQWRDRAVTVDVKSVVLEGVRIEDEIVEDGFIRDGEE